MYLDEAHDNYHTIDGGYAGFAEFVSSKGYCVLPLREPFTAERLANADVLVIANASNHDNDQTDWTAPLSQAFEPNEVAAVERWVADGGSLMLVADHQPFGGLAESMAAAFGFTFYNGFAQDSRERFTYPISKDDGTLIEHVTTKRWERSRPVEDLLVWTGQAFDVPPDAVSLFPLDAGYSIVFPDVAWEFTEDDPILSADGMSTGAVLDYGLGRLAVFGEAGMFTCQEVGRIDTMNPSNHR